MTILFDNNVKNAVVSEEQNGFSYHKGSIADGRLTQTYAALETMLLKAVIEKEAEEKYPEPNTKYGNGYMTTNYQAARAYYIEFWNSLIERLPSEDWLNKIQPDFDRKESYLHGFHDAIEVVKDNVKKLLPPLPSSAHCECETNGEKCTVTKIWL